MPIDVHAHYVPPQLIAAIKRRGGEIGVRLAPAEGGKEALAFDYGFKVRPFFPRLVEPVADRHRWLDEQRIDHQIVGTWPDIFGYGLPGEHCAAWHRMLNDTLAEWTAENAKRFSWISSVPLTDAEAAAQELERTVNAGALGVIISANIENRNIGELPLDPFWRKAEQLGVPVLLHPVLSSAVPRVGKFALGQIAHYTYDTTLGIGSLIMSGVLDRFPKLRLLLSHGGGTFPYLAGRFDVMHGRMDKAGQGNVAAAAPSAYAGRMAYDSIVHAPKTLRFLIDVVGCDNVLLGTDYSFPPADMAPLALLPCRRSVQSRQRRDHRTQSAPPICAAALIAGRPALRGPASHSCNECSILHMDRAVQQIAARISRAGAPGSATLTFHGSARVDHRLGERLIPECRPSTRCRSA